MSLAQVLADFKSSIFQCESLIANAHRLDSGGVPILPPIDQNQITKAAFLNLFIAWETFLENSFAELMTGSPTLNGAHPVKFVSPPTLDAARELVIGHNKYFDYGQHQNVLKVVRLYFQGGHPYDQHLKSIYSDLEDIRIMRNACAHITSTTQRNLEALALRIFNKPHIGIDVYRLLTSIDPRSATKGTVFATYKDKLSTAADLIAQG